MEIAERSAIVTKIDEEIKRAKDNVPTPSIGSLNPVWWNSQEGKVIKSYFKMALDSLGEALKVSIGSIGR